MGKIRFPIRGLPRTRIEIGIHFAAPRRTLFLQRTKWFRRVPPCVVLRKEEKSEQRRSSTGAGRSRLSRRERVPTSVEVRHCRRAAVVGDGGRSRIDAVRSNMPGLFDFHTNDAEAPRRARKACSINARSVDRTDAAAQVRPPSRGEDTCVLPRDTEPFASGRRCSFRSTSEKAIDERDRETRSERGMRKSRRLEPGQFLRFHRHGNVPRPPQIPLLHAFPKEHGTFLRKTVTFF